MGLNSKQQQFVDEYLKSFNGKQAAEAAGYKVHYNRLLGNGQIRQAIEEAIEDDLPPDDGLTFKQRLWIDAYIKTGNATEAARQAGYSGDYFALAQRGHELVKNSKIKAIIARRFDASAMSSNEVMARLSDQARGDLANFSDVYEPRDLEGNPKSHLVKKLKTTRRVDKDGVEFLTTEIELYNAQSALELIGKHHGLFNNDAGSSDDKPFIVRVVYGERANGSPQEPSPETG